MTGTPPDLPPLTTTRTAFLAPRVTPSVPRPQLEARLGPSTGASWTLVCGPPGAGKTTLVRAWLDDRSDPWAWIGITARAHPGPGSIVDLAVRAVQRARPDRPLSTLDTLDMDEGDGSSILARLIDELAEDPPETPPIVIVFDDAHLLGPDEWQLVRSMLGNVPPTLHPVIISRSDPPLPLARERASGHMTEVRARDLAFRLDDTARLLETTTGTSDPRIASQLQDKTEGWVAGVRLAALAIRDGADPNALLRRLVGSNSSVAEFLLEEVLDRQPEDRRRFLFATASLRLLQPDICDAVADRDDSSDVLRRLAADQLFVHPVEDQDDTYRFHPLLAQLLVYEQRRTDPRGAEQQHERAADWLIADGRPIEAIEHLLAAGDHARAHRLVVESFQQLYVGARRRDLDDWLVAIPDDVIAESNERAIDHCVALALMGNPDGARWWAFCSERLEPDDDWIASRLGCVVALYDSVSARMDDMRIHWDEARRRRPADRDDPFDEILMHWAVRLDALFGDPATAVDTARALVATPRELLPDATALSVLAGALDASGQHDQALAIARRSIDRWRADGEPDLPGMVDALVVAAKAARLAGDFETARTYADSAAAVLPLRAGPHVLSAIPAIEQARLDHDLGGSQWRTQLAGLAEELRIGGVPPFVTEWVDAARIDLESRDLPSPEQAPTTASRPVSNRGDADGLIDPLTERELTILRLLASHLTLPEIGETLHISRHTVKSHVSRIYRKLETTSRSQAVHEARRRGILSS